MSRFSVQIVHDDTSAYDAWMESAPSAHLLQTTTWARLQRAAGRECWQILVKRADDERVVLGALVIRYPLAAGFSYLYAPCGPVVAESDVTPELIEFFVGEVRKLARTLFVRIDPRLMSGGDVWRAAGFVKAPMHSQPEHTRILSLGAGEAELLAQMKQKTRYNIRLAEKKGLDIRAMAAPSAGEIDTFYALIEKTTERDGFSAHPKRYYHQLINALAEDNAGLLYLAYQGEAPVAGILVGLAGRQATYLHGASDYAYRQLMAPYALQWRAIRDARVAGCAAYDFWGTAPVGAGAGHPWAGVTRFKEGFGGEAREYVGTMEYPVAPFLYRAYCLAKKIKRGVK